MRFFQGKGHGFRSNTEKYAAEANFWREEQQRYVRWFQGNMSHFGIASPKPDQQFTQFSTIEKNAAATWTKLFQEPRYREDMDVAPDMFRGMRVLDIGCGPLPSALVFTDCQVYGLDHLIDLYRTVGFPIDEYNNDRFHFIQAKSECIPFENHFFDAVISANAIDHVDSIEKTSQEIRRVLKPSGIFRMHVHYHAPLETEPISFTDENFSEAFSWVPGLKKISTTQVKDLGFTQAPADESYNLWGNEPTTPTGK